jgi:hypothetical protein
LSQISEKSKQKFQKFDRPKYQPTTDESVGRIGCVAADWPPGQPRPICDNLTLGPGSLS